MSSSRDMVPMNIRDPFFKDPFFSSTWEEFDKMRQDMISSSKDFWGKVDKDFANFDEQVRKLIICLLTYKRVFSLSFAQR